MDNSMRAGAFVLGGLFFGVWLYLLLFKVPELEKDHFDHGLWAMWGGAGLVISGGVFAGRFLPPTGRLVLWVSTGIVVGLIVGAIIFQPHGEAFAAALTFLAGALVATAIPVQGQDPVVLWTPPEEQA